MNKREELAAGRVGGLSKPSKMPGLAYGLPAAECGVGSKLRGIKGSTCTACYAFKGNYRFSNVKRAQYRRLESLQSPTWVADMATAIGAQQWFRWHDSGDLQSMSHLIKIVAVAMLRPDVRFWLPTREYGIVHAYKRAGGHVPANLVIRQSAPMVNAALPPMAGPSSMVISGTKPDAYADTTHVCPAKHQDNKCGDCRACWTPNVLRVAYPIH